MLQVTYDMAVNIALALIYGAIILLVIQRVMEHRQFTYRSFRTPTGMEFHYRLGIYAGIVTVTRQVSATKPTIVRKATGWEIVLPIWYTDKDLSIYVMTTHPRIVNGNRSHVNDLEVFRQVVLKNNDSLECIAGQLFCIKDTYGVCRL